MLQKADPCGMVPRMIFKTRDRNRSKTRHIELNLRDINQLFNTMDPSPFNERDLDHDAEEFIVSWAREMPLADPLVLVVHLAALPQDRDAQAMIQEAIHHYFSYRLELSRLEFRLDGGMLANEKQRRGVRDPQRGSGIQGCRR